MSDEGLSVTSDEGASVTSDEWATITMTLLSENQRSNATGIYVCTVQLSLLQGTLVGYTCVRVFTLFSWSKHGRMSHLEKVTSL